MKLLICCHAAHFLHVNKASQSPLRPIHTVPFVTAICFLLLRGRWCCRNRSMWTLPLNPVQPVWFEKSHSQSHSVNMPSKKRWLRKFKTFKWTREKCSLSSPWDHQLFHFNQNAKLACAISCRHQTTCKTVSYLGVYFLVLLIIVVHFKVEFWLGNRHGAIDYITRRHQLRRSRYRHWTWKENTSVTIICKWSSRNLVVSKALLTRTDNEIRPLKF